MFADGSRYPPGEDAINIIRRENPVGDLDLTDDFRRVAGIVVGQFVPCLLVRHAILLLRSAAQ